MLVNLIVIIITLFAGYIYSQGPSSYVDSNYNRKRYIKLMCFILIFQSGLRNVAVGSDTYAYYEGFENIKKTSWSQIWQAFIDYYTQGIGKDPGYPLFEKIVQIIIPYNQLFLFVIDILFFSALGIFIFKNTTKLTDAIFAFILY